MNVDIHKPNLEENWDLSDLDIEKVKRFLKQNRAFRTLMLQYQCALMEIETKFRVLDAEFSLKHDRNPIESMKTRLKTPRSLVEKLRRRHLPISLASIEHNIFDIAGVRIICSFTEDVYYLADCFCSQSDIEVLEREDYIQSPKPNGYRSLHMIVKVPVFFANETIHVPVEIQFRTIAMDFWASLEHSIRYKKGRGDSQFIADQLRECASSSHAWDEKMSKLMNLVREESPDSDFGVFDFKGEE